MGRRIEGGKINNSPYENPGTSTHGRKTEKWKEVLAGYGG